MTRMPGLGPDGQERRESDLRRGSTRGSPKGGSEGRTKMPAGPVQPMPILSWSLVLDLLGGLWCLVVGVFLREGAGSKRAPGTPPRTVTTMNARPSCSCVGKLDSVLVSVDPHLLVGKGEPSSCGAPRCCLG